MPRTAEHLLLEQLDPVERNDACGDRRVPHLSPLASQVPSDPPRQVLGSQRGPLLDERGVRVDDERGEANASKGSNR